jgi:Holliday junction resolvase RusA-like endonuclease
MTNPRALSSEASTRIVSEGEDGARGVVCIELSSAISVNNLHQNVPGRGRITSNDYRIWKDRSGWELLECRPAKIKGPVALRYEFKQGRADLGNLEKAVTDLLVTHGVIEGDGPKIVREIVLTWGDVEGVRVTVCPV